MDRASVGLAKGHRGGTGFWNRGRAVQRDLWAPESLSESQGPRGGAGKGTVGFWGVSLCLLTWPCP